MLEVVITCVDYADYLQVTLPYTMKVADRIVVVTQKRDTATKRVCDNLDVPWIETDAFFFNGPFNKGRAINEGLAHCSRRDWVMQLDADIAIMDPLPKLETLQKDFLYGAHRLPIIGPEEWKFMATVRPRHRRKITLNPMKEYMKGGVPIIIGYFQLWHFPTTKQLYPDKFPDASSSDMAFSDHFGIHKKWLEDLNVYHLSMPFDRKGENWSGRKTKEFVL